MLTFNTVCCQLIPLISVVWGVALSAHAQVTQQWVARYNGPNNGYDAGRAVAVDGTGTVYVTGQSDGGASGADYTTVAYDAATGTQRWVARYNGPGNGADIAYALAADGTGRVYVTGGSPAVGGDYNYATVAYDAATGNELWVARYNGGSYYNVATAVAVDGTGTVYVTGESSGGFDDDNYVTVAYDAATGSQRWAARYSGPVSDSGSSNQPTALVVDGTGTVYVTGASSGDYGWLDYATVAYDAATGSLRWAARYSGPGIGNNQANALAVDGTGTVYVTGLSIDGAGGTDYATVAYDAATGTQRWVARYHDGGANAVAVDGTGTVYVTGSASWDYATVAYDAATGTQLWVAQYNGPSTDYPGSQATALAVDGTRSVYVTGVSNGGASGADYATIKYSQP